MAAVQAWQSVTTDDTQHLVMSMSRRLQAVIACNDMQQSTKVLNRTNLLFIPLPCPQSKTKMNKNTL